MKLKSLILGSVAAVGLSTVSYAADLGTEVLPSLDVCDALGLSGLTISSGDNCLQISGSVDYQFRIGDFRNSTQVGLTYDGDIGGSIGNDDQVVVGGVVRDIDWDTRARAYLQVVAASATDFGPARAQIRLRQVDQWVTRNEGFSDVPAGLPAGTRATINGGDHTNGIQVEEAFVQLGDPMATIISAGLRRNGQAGSIVNLGDDQPYSYLFISDTIDGGGVLIDGDDRRLGGHAIQVVSNLGNGIAVGVGLENIATDFGDAFIRSTTPSASLGQINNDSNLENVRTGVAQAGTLVGTVQYGGDNLTAHVSGLAFGILDGDVDAYAIHAGATGTFDMFRIRGAVGYTDNHRSADIGQVVHGLASAQGTFDLFTLGVSGEFSNFDSVATGNQTDYSVGARVGVAITEGVSINLDASYFRDAVNVTPAAGNAATDTYRLQAEVVAAITETISLTAAVGGFFGDGVFAAGSSTPGAALVRVDNLYYGRAGVNWTPGGNFTAGAAFQANNAGGYRADFTASKTFQ